VEFDQITAHSTSLGDFALRKGYRDVEIHW
jgi:hypothetical protein